MQCWEMSWLYQNELGCSQCGSEDVTPDCSRGLVAQPQASLPLLWRRASVCYGASLPLHGKWYFWGTLGFLEGLSSLLSSCTLTLL